MKKYQLPYGNGFQEVTLPEEKVLYDIHGNKADVLEDITAATLAAVRCPIASQPLQKVVRKGDKVAVIVSDVTRLVRTAEFLPVIISEINAAGVPDEDITIIVATGTHRAHTYDEDIAVCGKDIVKRIKIHQHDSRNNEELTDLGVTSFGTPILIDSYVAEADKVIITGAVSLHPMAGFGGGRKAVMPGVSGHATIMHNHAIALAPKVGDGCNPLCETGLLEGNPLHEDMVEVTKKLDPAFLVNMVFTPEGKLHEVVAGHWYKAWEKGCKDLVAMAGVPIKELADVVFASAGGSPKDMNLYQSCKAHMNAVFAVKKGGIMILTLECPDIKEPAIFTDWFSKSDVLQFEKDVRADFSIPAFVAFKTRCIVNSLTTYLVTKPENFEFVRQTGQIPVASLEEAWLLTQQELAKQGKDDYKITIMGHASATMPVLEA
ncbi:nickel-dependent lactate racemase [Phascolarctobacterium faecium]|uniref:nickel-dependent lactate racemase n=1 Tax=Phascolarctobacterium faecium TaxID=33025 RepID=UPI00352210DF